MKIISAVINDIPELYRLQLISFKSEAEMIGSSEIPALKETLEESKQDFENWNTLKLLNDSDEIIGAIRYREIKEILEVGRLMVKPEYRSLGLAQKLLAELNLLYPNQTKELYTCSKSFINIRLYEKMGYKPFSEQREESGLSFVYMRKQ